MSKDQDAAIDPRLAGLRVEEIWSFLVLADELHFARAASRLHLTPSCLSRRIARVENAFDLCLLHTTTRSVELTRDGHRFVAVAQRVLDALLWMKPSTSPAPTITLPAQQEFAGSPGPECLVPASK